jgi:hypothetical protein
MKIVFIIGLPGSGKTHYARTLVGNDVMIMDDFSKNDIQFLPSENTVNTLVIIDPNLCNSAVLSDAINFFRARYSTADFEYIYFENAPEKALRNIQKRNDNRPVAGFIQMNTKIYNPPAGALSIWQAE